MAFIDKINPDVPEGRLLIRNGEDVSTQSRYKKFSFLFNYTVNIILIFLLFSESPLPKKRVTQFTLC